MKTKSYFQSLMILLTTGMIFLLSSSTIAKQPDKPQLRDVIEGYNGWAAGTVTITVYIDNSFSDQEKDSVRVAIQRWNDAGCKPPLAEADTKDAHVTVNKGNPGAGNAGVYRWRTDADGKVTGGTIIIRDNISDPGLVEVATHELGHALGLDDTSAAENPSDVMRGTGSGNGTNGELSEHDLSEMQAAALAAGFTDDGNGNGAEQEDVYAIDPDQAIIPGESSVLSFYLPFNYPPGSELEISPISNDLLEIEFVEMSGHMLNVGVFPQPSHWSGKIYLNISIFADGEMHQYRGVHYVFNNPAPPVAFECPFEVVVVGNHVFVNWSDLHSYPFDGPLRSTLIVNGNTFYKVKPSGDAPAGYYGDYLITLEPGEHELTLIVDDYQVNSASYTEIIYVDGEFVIPTLSEWGVIILILLTLTVGMVFLYVRQTALAMPGGIQVNMSGIKPKLFDKKHYAKVSSFALLAGLGVLGLLYMCFGEITSADPFGTFVSMAIIAYMVHFVMLNRKTKVANK